MRKLLQPFVLRRGEIGPALIVMLMAMTLNALFIGRLSALFQQPGMGPHKLTLQHEFHLAGYDPYTYWCVSQWDYYYNVTRHPLLSWMVWPLSQLNRLLETFLGVNCAQYIVAAVLVFCTVYSFVFLFRILRQTVGLYRADALLLSAYFFSMAYILLSMIVPDHFTPSMMLLLLTLYAAGSAMTVPKEPSPWRWTLLLLTTAGVTLSNGAKVVVAFLFALWNQPHRNGSRKRAVLTGLGVLGTVVVLLTAVALWQQRYIVEPRQQAREQREAKQAEQERLRWAAMSAEQQAKEQVRQARRKRVLQQQAEKWGTPIKNEGLLKWTDVSTSRWQSLYENMLGESLLFHQEHFLEDSLVQRPVFVSYTHWWAYAIEAAVVCLFLSGIFLGRRNRFLQLCLCMFGIDLTIHLLLGFGLNEIHIMAPHWAFVIPIATGFVFRSCGKRKSWLRAAVSLLTLILLGCNSWQLVTFLLQPIH